MLDGVSAIVIRPRALSNSELLLSQLICNDSYRVDRETERSLTQDITSATPDIPRVRQVAERGPTSGRAVANRRLV